MSDAETEAILQTIQDCSEHTQCGVDDVAGLLHELKEQEQELTARLASIDTLIEQLDTLNQQTTERNEVRAFVSDLLRVFEHGGKGFPIGFPGDIGDGPKTAYDALPPKKWKPSEESA